MKKNDTDEAWGSGLGAGLFFGMASMALLWFGATCVGDYNGRLAKAEHDASLAFKKAEAVEAWAEAKSSDTKCRYWTSRGWSGYSCDEEKTK